MPGGNTGVQPTPPIVNQGGGVFGNIFGGGTLNNVLGLVGLGSGVLGSILNRPKGLSSAQNRILDQLLASISAQANAPLAVDPTQRNLLFEQIAGSAQGARNRLQDEFSGRGLGRSGLLGSELGRVERTAQGAQTAAVAGLLQEAQARRTGAQNQLQSLLFGIPSLQGASAAGVGLNSLSQTLGFLLALNMLGKK